MRYLTAGDAHGPGVVCVIEGLPAGVMAGAAGLERHLSRRRRVAGRSERQSVEDDAVELWGGLHEGRTTGAPVAVLIRNRAGPSGPPESRTVPRPGHADLAGAVKYGLADLVPVQERASARETVARCAAGYFASRLLAALGVEVFGLVSAVGRVSAPAALGLCDEPPGPDGWRALAAAAEASPVRCPWPAEAGGMEAAIAGAAESGDTLGGVVLVVATGLPLGLGSCMSGDRRLDGRLAQAVMSIPAVKGVEIGLGFVAASRPGSLCHDAICRGAGGPDAGSRDAGGGDAAGRAAAGRDAADRDVAGLPGGATLCRPTSRAGGLEGGMTCGGPLIVRAAVKPVPTLPRGLPSVDLATGAPRPAPAQRADICAAPAAAVVAEAAVAWELASAVVERWGGDTLEAMCRAALAWRGGP